jgi:BASS family bile acid:Na+ symporter
VDRLSVFPGDRSAEITEDHSRESCLIEGDRGASVNAREIVMFALKGSIMLTVFGFGLRASVGDLFYLLRRPRLLVLSLTAMFVIMPLFALFAVRVGHFSPAVAIALVAVSLSPVPPLLPRKMTKAGGIAPYGLMVTAATLAVLYIPLASELIGKYFGRPFGMSPGTVAKVVVVSILIPLAAGILLRKIAPALAVRIAHPVALIAAIVLLAGAVCILAFAYRSALALIGDGTLLVFAAFILVGLLVGHYFGGPDPDSRVVLALSTACRHPALALTIASTNFPAEHRVLGAILLYLVLNALLTIPYVSWQGKKIRALSSDSP